MLFPLNDFQRLYEGNIIANRKKNRERFSCILAGERILSHKRNFGSKIAYSNGQTTFFQRCILLEKTSRRLQRNINVVLQTLFQRRSINVVSKLCYKRWINVNQSTFPRWINVDSLTSTSFRRCESNIDPICILNHFSTSNQTPFQDRIDVTDSRWVYRGRSYWKFFMTIKKKSCRKIV